MKINWIIDDLETKNIQHFMESSQNHPFVKRRIERNVDIDNIPDVGRDKFWQVMVTCLLSTQQRSGPGSSLYRFCSQRPFVLRYKAGEYDRSTSSKKF